MYKKGTLYAFDSNVPRITCLTTFSQSVAFQGLTELNIVSFTTNTQYIFFAFEGMDDRLTSLVLELYETEILLPLEDGYAFVVVITDVLSMKEIKKLVNMFFTDD